MSVHLLWLWLWFIIGSLVNVLKRAYFKVTGPDLTTVTYKDYFMRYWPALLFRGVFGGALYWLSFYPEVLGTIAGWVGWTKVIPNLPQIGPVALLTGFAIDSILDFISTKIPWLQGQIPPLASNLHPPVD